MSSPVVLTVATPTIPGRCQGREVDIDSTIMIDFGDHDNLQALAAAFAAGGRRGSGLFATEGELFEFDKRLGTVAMTSTRPPGPDCGTKREITPSFFARWDRLSSWPLVGAARRPVQQIESSFYGSFGCVPRSTSINAARKRGSTLFFRATKVKKCGI